MMLNKRTLALLGLGALVGVAVLVKSRIDLRADADTAQTTAIDFAAGRSLLPGTLSNRTTSPQTVARTEQPAAEQKLSAAVAAAPAPDNPVYLESIGVIERLQKSRHDLFSPIVKGLPQRPMFRFTLDRRPLTELAGQQATVAWPINDGGVEFVKLTTLREQDGNLFISGDVVDGRGQFAVVMTPDHSLSGYLLSPRGMYSYSSQLDEIVGQRVEGPVKFD